MDHPAISMLICVIAAYAVAIAVYSVIRYRSVWSFVAVVLACVAVPLCLFIIPQVQVVLRAVSAVLLVDLFFRLIDFARQSRHGKTESIGWKAYCRFLIPFPLYLVVFGQKDRRLQHDQRSMTDLLRLLFGSIGVAIGFLLLFAANEITTLQTSPILDHITKLLIFSFTVEALAQALYGLEHLAGFDTRPIVDRAFFSRTPADFWHRFNTRVQSWWYLNVFIPSGGRVYASRSCRKMFGRGMFRISGRHDQSLGSDGVLVTSLWNRSWTTQRRDLWRACGSAFMTCPTPG